MTEPGIWGNNAPRKGKDDSKSTEVRMHLPSRNSREVKVTWNRLKKELSGKTKEQEGAQPPGQIGAGRLHQLLFLQAGLPLKGFDQRSNMS